ncbi:MAG: hypothetical protein E6H75_05300 [Betaproteobacteria bacterium]|nr:MAG: hypothetical protein E6H75_05300 [Betaproteobacteria bacterium]
MNPGLPGAGIGGLFYVLSALWMPICELLRLRRGQAPGRWPLVAKQFGIAVGIIAAMSGVFWALDTVLILQQVAAHAAGQMHAMWSLRVSALAVTSGVLATVLGAVHVVRLCLRLRTVRHAAR